MAQRSKRIIIETDASEQQAREWARALGLLGNVGKAGRLGVEIVTSTGFEAQEVMQVLRREGYRAEVA